MASRSLGQCGGKYQPYTRVASVFYGWDGVWEHWKEFSAVSPKTDERPRSEEAQILSGGEIMILIEASVHMHSWAPPLSGVVFGRGRERGVEGWEPCVEICPVLQFAPHGWGDLLPPFLDGTSGPTGRVFDHAR